MIRLMQGDARARLAELPPESVHCCVTSPPYYSLRSYGTEAQVWGGSDPGCLHAWGEGEEVSVEVGRLRTPSGKTSPKGEDDKYRPVRHSSGRSSCSLCGAIRCELGQEPTLAAYLANLVEVFESVRRVLHPTGLLFVNLGDSYAGGAGGRGDIGREIAGTQTRTQPVGEGRLRNPDTSLVPGSLCMAPARFALAMQEAGWLLRSEIVLLKGNPMPESVGMPKWERCKVKTKAPEREGGRKVGEPEHGGNHRNVASFKDERTPSGLALSAEERAEYADCPGCPKCSPNGGYVLRWGSGRPTSACEKLYMFAKSNKYFFNQEAVRVPQSEATIARFGNGGAPRKLYGPKNDPNGEPNVRSSGSEGILPAGANCRNWLKFYSQPLRLRKDLTDEQIAYVLQRIYGVDCREPKSSEESNR